MATRALTAHPKINQTLYGQFTYNGVARNTYEPSGDRNVPCVFVCV